MSPTLLAFNISLLFLLRQEENIPSFFSRLCYNMKGDSKKKSHNLCLFQDNVQNSITLRRPVPLYLSDIKKVTFHYAKKWMKVTPGIRLGSLKFQAWFTINTCKFYVFYFLDIQLKLIMEVSTEWSQVSTVVPFYQHFPFIPTNGFYHPRDIVILCLQIPSLGPLLFL